MGLVVHLDGGARGNPGPAGAGVVIQTEQGELIHEGGYYLGVQTNNAAEYLALLRALERVQRCAPQSVQLFSDSELLVRQVTGAWAVRNPRLAEYYRQAQMILLKLSNWSLRHVPREENRRADTLANMAMDQERDVILFDADHDAGVTAAGNAGPTEPAESPPLPRGPRPEPPSAAPAEATIPAGERAIRVVLATSPKPGSCPVAGQHQEEFTVTHALPAGLCLHAAHTLLPTLLAMLNTEPQEFSAIPTLTVHCSRPGCGAVFRVSPVQSGNGHHARGPESSTTG